MHNQIVHSGSTKWIRWTARLASLGVCAWFGLLLFLVATNEDKPVPEAVLALLLVALTSVACLAAWRWERAGGIAIIIGAIAIGIALVFSSSVANLESFAPFAVLLYVVPFGAVGTLFVLSDRMAQPKN